MIARFRTVARGVIAAVVCVGLTPAAQAQACGRKLSVLEIDVAKTAHILSEARQRIASASKEFDLYERQAQSATACPEGNTRVTQSHRETFGALGARSNLTRAEGDLACTEYFVDRISADMAAASAEADTRRVLRLTALSQRILVLDQLATATAAEAYFQVSKVDRLNEALLSVEALCVTLDDIYE